MNLPNKLTISRVIFIPFYIFFLMTSFFELTTVVADILLIAACITDALDGKLARKYGLVSTFGKFIDPLADKLLVASAIICFVALGRMPFWVCIIIIAREFFISGFRLILAGGGTVLAASIWGKLKTVWQMLMCIFLTLDMDLLAQTFNLPDIIVRVYWIIAAITMYIALALTVISMIDYFYKNRSVFSSKM